MSNLVEPEGLEEEQGDPLVETLAVVARTWIQDYLKDRTLYVIIGAAQSRMVPVSSGVPQGSVIGPLLYAIYTNELSNVVKSESCQDTSHQDRSTLFGRQCSTCGIADDTTYTVSSKSRRSNATKMERCLEDISLLLQDNFLVLNQPKTSITECMIGQKRGKIPGPPHSLLVIKYPGVTKLVTNTEYTRILGGNVQGNLSWMAHLESGDKALLPGVRKQLRHLKYLGRLIPYPSRLNLANGLLISRLNYLMPLWGSAPPSQLNRAQVVMNAAARWATGLHRRTKISTLLNRTGWYSIREMIRISTVTQIWKMVHLGKPQRPLERWQINEKLEIAVDPPRLQHSKRCFRWRGSREWNLLPEELRENRSLYSFKKNLKKYIKQQRQVPQQPPD